MPDKEVHYNRKNLIIFEPPLSNRPCGMDHARVAMSSPQSDLIGRTRAFHRAPVKLLEVCGTPHCAPSPRRARRRERHGAVAVKKRHYQTKPMRIRVNACARRTCDSMPNSKRTRFNADWPLRRGACPGAPGSLRGSVTWLRKAPVSIEPTAKLISGCGPWSYEYARPAGKPPIAESKRVAKDHAYLAADGGWRWRETQGYEGRKMPLIRGVDGHARKADGAQGRGKSADGGNGTGQ